MTLQYTSLYNVLAELKCECAIRRTIFLRNQEKVKIVINKNVNVQLI
jgi:hypothetical protein